MFLVAAVHKVSNRHTARHVHRTVPSSCIGFFQPDGKTHLRSIILMTLAAPIR